MEHRANLLWIPPDSDYNIKEVRKAAAKQGAVQKRKKKSPNIQKVFFFYFLGYYKGGLKKYNRSNSLPGLGYSISIFSV